ncbi:hypothetical protein EDC01DRAFT_109322 [Geopyxis carbonaria]|nr:hypothetical protein EDC01DRAFT_109322 [Geopyxis carbonaria]
MPQPGPFTAILVHLRIFATGPVWTAPELSLHYGWWICWIIAVDGCDCAVAPRSHSSPQYGWHPHPTAPRRPPPLVGVKLQGVTTYAAWRSSGTQS